jgi:pimeloyl-ACP methyl ester carboxylesterase
MLIWGMEDQTVPFKHSAKFMQLVQQTEFHAIDQAKHIPQFERPEKVNPLIINFLST